MKHLLFAALALALTPGFAAAEAPRSIVVMDGSGSMWGQIDGRPKLEIARETVAQVLGTLPQTQDIGLMAYGHRRKGDCSDIELMVPPTAGSADEIVAKVNAMKFLGKTPLSEAVRKAAEALRYGEEAATVVLVTDGLETCAADPCALGRELEANGLNFTAHVIGLGLTKAEGAEVACLAEETGGRYLEARDAASLTAALAQAVSDTPTPAPAPLPTTTLTAPASAPMGSKVLVGWTGTPADLDTIEVGPVGGAHFDYVYVSEGNPVTIQMPGAVGLFELRYKNADQSVIATLPIEVTEAPLTLSAPDRAVVGQLVPVTWSGPDAEYDNIQLRKVGDDSYITYDYVRGKNPVALRMPDAAGAYEFTYKLNDSEVILARPISVLPAGSEVPSISAELMAPEQAEVRSALRIVWKGPGYAEDSITLRRKGEEDLLDYVAIGKGDHVTLTMPSEPGDYELGYLFANEAELTSRAIVVFAAEIDQPVSKSPMPEAGLPIPITLRADTGAAEVMVQWSAVPAPEGAQPAAPEAWAMNESVIGPVEAAFLAGDYDVRGDAGDAVFAGRISVVSGGTREFVIPYDATLSPAGIDAPAATPSPQDPVPVTFRGEYQGMALQWWATPVSGQESGVLGTGGYSPDPWATQLDAGEWLIEGQAETGKGRLYVARVSVIPSQPQELTLLRTAAVDKTPLTAPDGAEIIQRCIGEVACTGASQAGLRLALLPGWATTEAYLYETAGGAVAEQPTMEFYSGDPLQVSAVLNPRQWDAMLGPCEAIALGGLCAMADADRAGVVAIRNTLQALDGPESAPEGAAENAIVKRLQGTPIMLPEGINPLELLAPRLLKD